MTNSTDEYWDVDGQSLHTYAWALETTGEHLRAAATLKGTDIPVSLRPGEVWSPKVPGPRVITLKGWVRGTSQDGVWGSDPHALMNDNYEYLKSLLWRTDRQVSLTKRWRSVSAHGLIVATAKAEFSSGLDNLQIIDQYRDGQAGKFTVDMRLSDPYFYGTEIVLPSRSGGFTIDNEGADTARKLLLTFAGAGSLTNLTTGRTLTVAAAGTYDVWSFGAPAGHLVDITVAGQSAEAFWMTLVQGPNNLNSTVGVQISYWPVYL